MHNGRTYEQYQYPVSAISQRQEQPSAFYRRMYTTKMKNPILRISLFPSPRQAGDVVCRQMGYARAARVSTGGSTSKAFLITDVVCNGNEKSLLECQHSSTETIDACPAGPVKVRKEREREREREGERERRRPKK